MKILIIPTIRETYKNQFEFCIDLKLLNFLKKVFKNSKLETYNLIKKNDYDLLVLSGGNSSILKKKVDRLRDKINNSFFRHSLKKKKPILGICHGAQFLAKKNGFKIKKKNNHIGYHKVIFNINKNRFNKVVNSFHNEAIEYKKKNHVNIFGLAEDNTIECFHIKNQKILGVMWHPERYSKIKNFDLKLIKDFYATNNIVGR